ncbi:MAG: ferrochelatase [Planctomycetes bacterium]|nr:ferrochelatase [Planctomycetota bacterium]MCB9868702.1 ferrochelatase [Planctomycetota bacterium]MCB9889902.1 ferrochelatase [Planctomycetota bacterium]
MTPIAPEQGAGLLLLNLGTPDAPTKAAVRPYLAQFLTDPYVVDIPAPLRYALVYGLILPRRAAASAAAYATIWTDRGSPLRFHTEDLARRAAERTGWPTAVGMRYGNPSLRDAAARLAEAGCQRVVVFPLFPQYAESSWRTGVEAAERALRTAGLRPLVVAPYYEDPRLLACLAAQVRAVTDGFAADRLLMSFHGLPVRHVRRTDHSPQPRCLIDADCCATMVDANRDCYRAQCFATARSLAAVLGLPSGDFEVAFQSRLGRTPWIGPSTDQRVVALAREGCRRLAVVCPSFPTDCLETLEEIGERAAAEFRACGGEELRLVPALNSAPQWADAVATMARERLASAAK